MEVGTFFFTRTAGKLRIMSITPMSVLVSFLVSLVASLVAAAVMRKSPNTWLDAKSLPIRMGIYAGVFLLVFGLVWWWRPLSDPPATHDMLPTKVSTPSITTTPAITLLPAPTSTQLHSRELLECPVGELIQEFRERKTASSEPIVARYRGQWKVVTGCVQRAVQRRNTFLVLMLASEDDPTLGFTPIFTASFDYEKWVSRLKLLNRNDLITVAGQIIDIDDRGLSVDNAELIPSGYSTCPTE